jgi:hypothetical protein
MATRLLIVVLASAAALTAGPRLSNDKIIAEFSDRGLTSIRDSRITGTFRLTRDDFAVVIDGKRYDSSSLPEPTHKETESRVVFTWKAGAYAIDVIYEVRSAWRFVSKGIVIAALTPAKYKVDEIVLFHAALGEAIKEAPAISRARPNLGTLDYGACLRLDRSRGLLVTAQNPFLAFDRKDRDFTLSYKPDVEWDSKWAGFVADLALLAPYELSGETVPEKMRPEWQAASSDDKPGLDLAEIQGFTDAVRAFLLYKPTNPLNLMVGWCVNDYQIDIATPEGRTEYKRIIDRAAELGAEHVLFAPSNSDLARRSMSRDDWKWEYVLWLGLGQKIRRNEWDPATGEIPPSVREMLDYAKSKNVGLLAYVYPVLGFEQNRDWLVTARGQQRANLGNRSFQDWLIQALEAFYAHTGITGYSFDHTFLNFEGASRYAQWAGWRRVLEVLRNRHPEIVIDGRQAYQNYGPWSWLAGSYPHPTATDEQPESFNSFPDLKLDRVSADRERFTAFWYRMYEFAPSEIVPGFITHQTGRNDDTGRMPSRQTEFDEILLPFRQRDWDYLGWRYSLLSSISVAGWNNVLNMIPARDPAEYEHFTEDDRKFFRYWIDWTDANKEYLRAARPILGQPAVGKVDGMAAIVRDSGYIFLFNPNGRRMATSITLDDSIGLARGGRYVVQELFPLKDRRIGKPGAGLWSYGDVVSRELDGGTALVLEITPDDRAEEPVLYNAPGTVRIERSTAYLDGVLGEAGTTEILQIAADRVMTVDIGGAKIPVKASKGLIEFPVTFSGARFHHYQQLDSYRKDFTGGPVTATFRIPQRIFDQLAARRKAWPIPWTEEDLRSTWLAPERLLLFLQFAEPDDRWTATLKIDGQPIELKKAYASVRVNRRNFVGFYADISTLKPDVDHRLELETPTGLKPGQFQGVFVENVETDYTEPLKTLAADERR